MQNVHLLLLATVIFIAEGSATPTYVAKRTDQSLTLDGVNNEAFWSDAQALDLQLTRTGGGTKTIDNTVVKVAYTKTQLYVSLTWPDPTNSNIKQTAGSHEDRAAIIFAEQDTPMLAPCMVGGTNGAVTGGVANMWHWKAARTDSGGDSFTQVSRRGLTFHLTNGTATFKQTSYNKTGWGGNFQGVAVGQTAYYDPVANEVTNVATNNLPITPAPHPHSFATNEFLNTSARYHESFTEYNLYGRLKTVDPMDKVNDLVWAKGTHSSGSWTVEYRRELTDADWKYDISFDVSKTYKVALGMYDGGQGDDEDVKQVSGWFLLKFDLPTVTKESKQITVARTKGNPELKLDGVANEPFWADAPQTTVPFYRVGSGAPTTLIPEVKVKAAHTDDWLYILVDYADPTASSFINNGSGLHEDRAALMFAQKNTMMATACMRAGSNGATQAGTANMWHWKAARTDSDGDAFAMLSRRGIRFDLHGRKAYFTGTSYSKSGWGGSYSGVNVGDRVFYDPTNDVCTNSVTGFPVTPAPHAHSFATNEYINTEYRYHESFTEYNLYGMLLRIDPLDKINDLVWAKGKHQNGRWSIEFKRKLLTPDKKYDLQFDKTQSYKLAFSMYEGGQGDDHADKQVTAWADLHFDNTEPSSSSSTSDPDFFETKNTAWGFLVGIALGAIIVFVVMFAIKMMCPGEKQQGPEKVSLSPKGAPESNTAV